MHIICPHCTTSYAIDLATLGAAGRTVRCSRCKEVWLARAEDATEIPALAPAMAAHASMGQSGPSAESDTYGQDGGREQDVPVVDSPSISADASPVAGENTPAATATDWAQFGEQQETKQKQAAVTRKKRAGGSGKPVNRLSIACVAMGALAIALMVWRIDVVRLLPQTATFYRMIGLDVNLRGLAFRDIKVTSETVEGKAVLVIEGMITSESRKPVELPRLRFSVRDAKGAEIYAWNAVLEQPVLKPGEKAIFKSRLASPPPEGRQIDVRFFNKRDIAGSA